MTTEHEATAEAIRKRRETLLGAAHECLSERMRAWPHVISDLPAYESPITGKWVHGRRARREDLKRNGCIEYDPGMKDDAVRRAAESDAKLERAIGETVDTIYNQWPGEKRRQFDRRS